MKKKTDSDAAICSQALFAALSTALEPAEGGQIGTLGEHTLHCVLKHYFEPDTSKHEIKIGRSYADILRDGRVFEIQTRALYRLKKKLDTFLSEYEVTVVFPICVQKTVSWVDEKNCTVSKKRKSPKRGNIADALPELYGVCEYFGDNAADDRFSVMLVLYDGDEYRALDGWGRGGKRGSNRLDIVPTGIRQEIFLGCCDDCRELFVPMLPDTFTLGDMGRIFGLRGVSAWRALKFLTVTGCAREKEKQGKKIIYEKT
ncbi:MAG TPA: hypothetical protein PLT66_04205 [Bacillota bacterium]|nr:hypothetical protein [Bacillota bacterium]